MHQGAKGVMVWTSSFWPSDLIEVLFILKTQGSQVVVVCLK